MAPPRETRVDTDPDTTAPAPGPATALTAASEAKAEIADAGAASIGASRTRCRSRSGYSYGTWAGIMLVLVLLAAYPLSLAPVVAHYRIMIIPIDGSERLVCTNGPVSILMSPYDASVLERFYTPLVWARSRSPLLRDLLDRYDLWWLNSTWVEPTPAEAPWNQRTWLPGG